MDTRPAVVTATHRSAHAMLVLMLMGVGCETDREAASTARVELRLATREDSGTPIYELLGLPDSQPRVAYGSHGAGELHLPRAESVRLEIRSPTAIVLSVEGSDEELAIRPGTTFVHLRVTDGTATALLAARRCEEGSCAVRVPILLEDPAIHREWIRAGMLSQRHAPAACGELLFASKGCAACHIESDEVHAGGAGGSLRDLLGTTRTFADGTQLLLHDEAALDAYVRTSITWPHTQVIAGRSDVMPQLQMSADELVALVAYIRCLSMPCETPGCAALCDEDPATLVTAGLASPHGSAIGCSEFSEPDEDS